MSNNYDKLKAGLFTEDNSMDLCTNKVPIMDISFTQLKKEAKQLYEALSG